MSTTSAAIELDAARRIPELEERNEAFAAAAVAQRAAIESLREILMHMVRNEGYQQAVNLLYEIQRAQERIRSMTERAKEEALGDVVGDREKDQNGGEQPENKDGGEASNDGDTPPVEKEAGSETR